MNTPPTNLEASEAPAELNQAMGARLRRWAWPCLAAAVIPKCLLCLLAYAGAGTALGLAGPELCGATVAPEKSAIMLLILLGLMIALYYRHFRRR